VSKGLSCLDWACALRAPKLFKGLWKVAVGLVETSLAPKEFPPKEFETEGERASSALLPPRTGISRAADIVVGERGGGIMVKRRGVDSEENKGNYFWVSRI
jgi:hypothetical protein